MAAAIGTIHKNRATRVDLSPFSYARLVQTDTSPFTHRAGQHAPERYLVFVTLKAG
jgi:hypothetical protein